MKKILLTIVAVLGFATLGNAQSIFHKGTSMVNVGIGFGTESNSSIVIPPLSASYEFGIVDNMFSTGQGSLGLGFYTGYAKYKYDLGYIPEFAKSRIEYSSFVVAPQLSLHYQFVPKLDTYASLLMGYRLYSYNNGYKGDDGEFAWGIHVGGRYMFSPNVGAFVELGYGVSNVSAGATFRF